VFVLNVKLCRRRTINTLMRES